MKLICSLSQSVCGDWTSSTVKLHSGMLDDVCSINNMLKVTK